MSKQPLYQNRTSPKSVPKPVALRGKQQAIPRKVATSLVKAPKTRSLAKVARNIQEHMREMLVEEAPAPDRTTVVMRNTTIITAASSVVDDVFPNDPSSCVDWANYAAAWHQYRVKSHMIEFIPTDRYNKDSTLDQTGPVVAVVDREVATALTSLDAAFSHANSVLWSLDDPATCAGWVNRTCQFSPICAEMLTVNDKIFIDSTSPGGGTWWIKLFSAPTLNVTYGYVFETFEVEFINRA